MSCTEGVNHVVGTEVLQLGIPLFSLWCIWADLLVLQERWSRIFTVFDNGQSNIVSRRPRRLAYGRRIRCMRRRVIVDLASAGPLEVKFIITLRRSTPVIEYRRFELGPPGESKLPLSNRKYTDFLKILNNKNFYKFLDFYRRFRVLLHY